MTEVVILSVLWRISWDGQTLRAAAMLTCRTRFVQKYPIGELSDSDEEDERPRKTDRRPTLGDKPPKFIVDYCREVIEAVQLRDSDD